MLLFQRLNGVERNYHDRSNSQNNLSSDMSTTTELQCFLHPLKWKICLDKGSEVSILYESSNFCEPSTVGFNTDHCGTNAPVPSQVLPRLLRESHEGPAFI
jgi:hypothetical protein